MFRRIILFIVVLLMSLFSSAHAQPVCFVTYNYVGNNFSSVTGTGPITTQNRVTVSLTFKVTNYYGFVIQPNNPNYGTEATLLYWSISDGVHTINNFSQGTANFRLNEFNVNAISTVLINRYDVGCTGTDQNSMPFSLGCTHNDIGNWEFDSVQTGKYANQSSGWNSGQSASSRTRGGFSIVVVPLIVTKALGDPNKRPGGVAVSEPIDVGTGNVYDQITDYETTGQNKLSFIRYYNSLDTTNTVSVLMGRNWRSNYDRHLIISSSSYVSLVRGDGQGLQFTLNGSNWIPDTDVNLKMAKSGTTWTVTDADDTVETYSSAGSSSQARLISIRSRNGYTQTLNYTSNRLTSVTDSYSRTLSFTYQDGLLQQVNTPDGLALTYGYDSSGLTSGVIDRLKTVTYSTTPQKSQTYLYENANLRLALTGITDENGNRYASWTYDQYGRGTSSKFGTGALLTQVAYNDTDGSRTVTYPLGQQEVYQFVMLQGVPKVSRINRPATATTAAASKVFTYDANGYTASETDWNGNLTTYTNDTLGRPTQTVEAAGTPLARTTTISYYQNFHVPSVITAPNLTTTFTYDANANPLTKTQTDTTTGSVPYSTAGQNRTWTYTWNNTGLLTSIQNPRTDVTARTTFDYATDGSLIKITNPMGQQTQTTQHKPGGLPLTISDANGVVSRLTYDVRLRPLTSAVTTSVGVLTTSFTYDPAGNLLRVTLPDGSALTNSYDIAHRLTSTTDLLSQTIAYTLDAGDNRTQTRINDPLGFLRYQNSASFDAIGRTIGSIGGAGQKTQSGYDSNGNAITQTDPRKFKQLQVYDALNRLVKSTDAAKGVTTFAYDAADHLLSVTAPNSALTRYVYNGFGNVIQKISPDSGTTVYLYDANGNQTRQIDAAGIITNSAYDALDRLTATTFPANAAENVTYTYDQTGYGFSVGRLTTVADAVGTLHRSYDERGNVLSETRSNAASTLATNYTYDAANRLASITYPSGWKAAYLRDVMGRVTAMTLQAFGSPTIRTVVSNIGYLPFGPVNSLQYGNGIFEGRSFDADYRLVKTSAGGTNKVQTLRYDYDPADNVLSVTDSVTQQNSQTFQYDALERLTRAVGNYGTLNYQYDRVGNRLSQNAGSALTAYSYAPQSNRLTVIKTGGIPQTVGYTATGNISSTGAVPNQSLTYNQSNRLAAVISGGQTTAQYGYDAFGQRLVKTTASGTTRFQYDINRRLLEETTNSGTAQTDYLYLDDGRLIATLTPSNGNLYFIHPDRLGTPQLATDSTQIVVWSASYLPFGQTNAISGSLAQKLRLPGQYLDTETGWHQNGFRDYVPSLGRYLESDPIGLLGGLNTYAYVEGNPLKNIDRWGLVNVSIVDPRDPFYNNAKYYNPPDVFTVAGHGMANDPNNIYTNGNSKFPLSYQKVGDMILKQWGMNPLDMDKPIYSLVCKGNLSGFNANLAQYLADQTGQDVTIYGANVDVTLTYFHSEYIETDAAWSLFGGRGSSTYIPPKSILKTPNISAFLPQTRQPRR